MNLISGISGICMWASSTMRIRRLVGLFEHESRRARVVGVLGDEPLALVVDDDAGEQDLRRVGGGGDEHLVQVLGDSARGDAHSDAEAVVVGVAQDVGLHHAVVLGAPLLAQRGCVLGDHLGVHRETARGDDDRLRLDRTGFGEVLPATPTTAPSSTIEVGRSGLVADLDAELVGPLHQEVDDHRGATEFTGHRHGVPARRWLRLLAERPHLLVARVRQALGARRNDDLARVEAALELKTQVLQPVEVFDAAVAVRADLVVLGFRDTATRYLYISSAESAWPVACCTAVPPPR